VDFRINSMVMFHSFLYVYQRVDRDDVTTMAIEIDGLLIKNGDFPWQTVSHNQMVSLPFFWKSPGSPELRKAILWRGAAGAAAGWTWLIPNWLVVLWRNHHGLPSGYDIASLPSKITIFNR